MREFSMAVFTIAGFLIGLVWSVAARRWGLRVPRFVHIIAAGALALGLVTYWIQPAHPWDSELAVSIWYVLFLPSVAYWAFAFVLGGPLLLALLLRITRLDRVIAHSLRTRPRLTIAATWLAAVAWLWAGPVVFQFPARFISIGIPLVAGWRFWNRFRFMRRNRGVRFVVATRRRGWFDFIQNNVLPALEGATVVWSDPRDPLPEVVKFIHGTRVRWRKPYLVVVGHRSIDVYGLHDLLLPLKRDAKRSIATQRAVANLIAAAGAPVAEDSRPN